MAVTTESDNTAARPAGRRWSWRVRSLPRGPASERVLRVAQRIRLSVALVFAAALPFAPGLTRVQGLSLSAATLSYVAVSMGLEAISIRHPAFPAQLINPFIGLLVITLVVVAIPRAMVAGLLFFALCVTFYTSIGGLALGLWLSVAVVPCAFAANALAPKGDQIDPFTLAMFALLVPSLVVIVDRLTAERRRTAVALTRLHDTLGAVTAQPELRATLDSIASSIGQAVGATLAGVMMRDGDDIALAARTTTTPLTPAEVELFTRAELELGSKSPLGYMLERNERVVIPNLAHDHRFQGWSTPWSRTLEELGCASVAVVPLRLGGDVIGAMAVAFTWRGGLDPDDLAFLEAYAERASGVIVRARAYEQEHMAAEKLAQADHEKSEFLALVSHELRTPLTAVKGFVDTVLLHWERLPEDERRDLLTRASSNADELTRLVGQLLDFARIDAASVHVSPHRLDVAMAVDLVVRDLAPVLADHLLEVDVPDDLAIMADADAFSHVLVNLLTNAVKFSLPGGRILIEACEDGATVVISVTDDGIGVPEDEQSRIFDRFYQADAAKLSRRGTGIGLTIAKRFTELQGGQIWVDSQTGFGSTFSFTMPAVLEPATEKVGT